MSRKILVVDDQRAIRNMFKAIFSKTDYEVDLAEDGVIAFAAAKNTHYDMVLTDYHMPNMNGIELVRKLRAEHSYNGVPILVVTTEGNNEKKVEGKEAGATGWMTKPIKPEVLLPVVHRLLS